ncbi:MAG: prolipoprotein diacylglyceryl transferase [Opitutae bacterium]|nr:prolipoprotein diacylglyceryl transferase [Opitutae bacterium]
MSFPLAYWVHNLSPFLGPHWGNFGIRYYGLAYVLGFVVAAWLLVRYARAGRSQLPEAGVADLITAIVLGVLIGGRLGSYLLYDGWRTFFADPLALLRVWEGGMASHGGFIGVAIALVWFARARRIPFLHLGDLIASTAPAGLCFGRIANFINGELWGKITDVPWAVIFPHSAPPYASVHLIQPRHPSQLYAAALEGALLLAFMQWRFWRTEVVATRPGRLSGEFLLAYAVMRSISEVFREPDASLILGLSRGTFYSLFFAAVGLWLIYRRPAMNTGRS